MGFKSPWYRVHVLLWPPAWLSLLVPGSTPRMSTANWSASCQLKFFIGWVCLSHLVTLVFIFKLSALWQYIKLCRSRWVGTCNSHTKSWHFLQTDLFLVYRFFCERKAIQLQWHSHVKLVSCDCLWQSHGSLITGKFDQKINRSMKTLWKECGAHASAPDICQTYSVA